MKTGYEHESRTRSEPVTLRRSHSLPTSYPGRHREQVEALRAEIKWEGKPEHATGAKREV